jgi:hypothetical protein
MARAAKAANKRGRPSTYTTDIANRICQRLALGEPLARICDDPDMPSFWCVWNWENTNEAFAKLSMRARELGTHYMADDCVRIADDKTLDPQDKRIRVDTRLRLIGKWNAKAYGDKQSIELDGRLETQGSLADHEAAAKLAAILEAVKKREG